MPQAQGLMAGHNNMVGQTASQGQFMTQTQFPPGSGASGAMSVAAGPGMGQPPAQAAITQVRCAARSEEPVGFLCCYGSFLELLRNREDVK